MHPNNSDKVKQQIQTIQNCIQNPSQQMEKSSDGIFPKVLISESIQGFKS